MHNLSNIPAGLSMIGALFGLPDNVTTVPLHFRGGPTTATATAYEVPTYNQERLEQIIKAKLVVAGHRVDAALQALLSDNRYTNDQRQDIFMVAVVSVSVLLNDQSVAGLTASYNEDGELLLTTVSPDKRTITDLRVSYEFDEAEVFLTYSRMEEKRSVFNIYHRWQDILPQIIANVTPEQLSSPASYALSY